MNCRPGCAGCCIHIHISSPVPGYPDGKPAGVKCKNLDETNLCKIWNTVTYPPVCREFTPTREFCGFSNEEASLLLSNLEKLTSPGGKK